LETVRDDTKEARMHDERDKPRDEKDRQPVGQDSPKSENGEIGEATQPGAGSAPPRSMGTRGTEFGQFNDPKSSGQQGQSGTGQADLGSQAGSTLSGHTDQQELGELGGEVDQPGSTGGARGQDFILREGGALEGEEEDVEAGQSRSGESDVERP
jgi:hypothetical protein